MEHQVSSDKTSLPVEQNNAPALKLADLLLENHDAERAKRGAGNSLIWEQSIRSTNVPGLLAQEKESHPHTKKEHKILGSIPFADKSHQSAGETHQQPFSLRTEKSMRAADAVSTDNKDHLEIKDVDKNAREVSLPNSPPVRITFVSPDDVRIESGSVPENERKLPELMIVKPDSSRASVPFKVEENNNTVSLTSDRLSVSLNPTADGNVRLSFAAPSGRKVIDDFDLNPRAHTAALDLRPHEHIYGFGDKRLSIDQRGNSLLMINKDAFASETNNSYKSVPFYRSSEGYGLFLHSWHQATFDVGKSEPDRMKIDTQGDKLDFYVFANFDPKKVIADFTDLTGHATLLPKWALGFQQSKASYEGTEGLSVVREMRRRHLPVDGVYYDDYPEELNWKKFSADLHKEHIHLTIGGNPFYIGDSEARENASDHNRLLKDKSGSSVFEHAVEIDEDSGLLGPKASYVDFFNRAAGKSYMQTELKQALQAGADLGMADFGELDNLKDAKDKYWPSIGKSLSAAHTRNLFSLAYVDTLVKGSAEITGRRETAMVRPGTAGTQRYGWATTGDSEVNYQNFGAHLRALISLSNTGFSNIGYDIGGWQSKGSDDLYARWFGAGTFNPFMWAHGQQAHEPFAHGAEVESASRSFLELRYKMLPYLYSLNEEAHRTGVPMLRSLSLQEPKDERAARVDDEFYLGDGMLVAPVTNPKGRQVYLPKGTWYDFFGDEKATRTGGDVDRSVVPMDRVPVYVRAGSIVPMGPVMQYSSEKPSAPLTVHYYAHPSSELGDGRLESRFPLYEDDGTSLAYKSGNFRRTSLHFDQSQNEITFDMSKHEGNKSYVPTSRGTYVTVHGAVADRVTLGETVVPKIPGGTIPKGPYWRADDGGGTTVFLPKRTDDSLHLFTK